MWSMNDLLKQMDLEGIPHFAMSSKQLARVIEITEDLIISGNDPEAVKEYCPDLYERRMKHDND